jgi:uncharacterized protein (UPF0147 family)
LNSLTSRIRDVAKNDEIPSNVADLLDEAAEVLEDESEEMSVRVNTAGSLLDQVSNDPNIRQHTRTEIWNLVSSVESLEESDGEDGQETSA